MRSLFTISAILIQLNVFAQLTDIPKPWIDVADRTDSLVAELQNQGMDSIISYYRLRYHYDYFHPENNTHDHKSSVTVWKKNDTVYFKKINQFYESETEIRDFKVLFDFYSFNKLEIDTTSVRLKHKAINDSLISVGPYRTHDRGFSLFYNIGITEREIHWGEIDLEYHEGYPTDYLTSLSSKLFTWTKILEKEIMFIDINEIWTPIKLKYYSEDEEKEMIKNWIEKTESEIESLREEFKINKNGK
jgi:hypothetical protein